jgi:hypothetical protein
MKNREILTVCPQKYLIIRRMKNSEYRIAPDSIAGVENKVASPDSHRQSSLLVQKKENYCIKKTKHEAETRFHQKLWV